MPVQPRILVFAGSTREGSFNKKLARLAAKAAERLGAQVTYIDLRDHPLPLYDGDLESAHGLPENAKKLKKLMKEHHGFLISAPEYNSSITGVLKNAIDWASRSEPGEAPLLCFTEKFAGLMSASPGALGGLRGLTTLRSILENIGTHVIPLQMALPKAHEAFDADGSLKDPKQQATLEKLVKTLCHLLTKYHS